MSQIFDIVEELEKERKKNKELEDRIDKAIEYIGQETFRYSMCFVDNETGLIDLKRSDFKIKQLSPKKVEKLLNILGDNNE